MALRLGSSLKPYVQKLKIQSFLRAHSLSIKALHNNAGQRQYRFSNVQKFLMCVAGGAVLTCGYLSVDNIRKFTIPSVVADTVGLRDRFNFIADVADVAAPSVVYIEIRDTRRFNHVTGQHIPVSAGSGFIVKSDGLIMTNAHVVLQKMSKTSTFKIAVKLQDGRMFDADIETVDKKSDLATLRIPIKDLPTIKLGKSCSLTPGEFVLALGSPLALTNTVTCGIISAYRKSEEIGMKDNQTVFVQTDASINNGNSGGPLMNIEGEAVGINCMNIIPGISFATPIDQAVSFLKENSDAGRRMRMKKDTENLRYIGVVMLSLSGGMLDDLRRTELEISPKIKSGILLQNILPESPADRGGLNPGDIVTHVNGKEVKNSSDIYDALLEKGKKLDMTVYRGLKQLRIVVEPEE